MVNQTEKQKLDSLLEAGAITPKEYGYLLKDAGLKDREKFEKREKPSLGKNILSFILTIIAIGVVLFGTCIMNLAIVDHREYLTLPLIIAWPLFPVVLFGWIAHKTKNAGMKWAVIFLAIGALLVAAMSMG